MKRRLSLALSLALSLTACGDDAADTPSSTSAAQGGAAAGGSAGAAQAGQAGSEAGAGAQAGAAQTGGKQGGEGGSGEGGAGGGSAGQGGDSGQGGEGGGAGRKVVSPSLFDCNAAASPPERATSVPVGCATDRTCKTRLVAAHRGAGGDLGRLAPENTLSAIRAAVAYGVDFIETDPRPSKDGVIVNVHDTDVARVTTGKGEVSAMTLDELKALTLKTSKYEGDFSCERIATIEEVLTLARGRVHVLLDANKTDDVAGLVDLVHKTDTLDWAIFDTGSPDKIEQALALEPKLHTMIRVETEAELADELARFSAHPPVIVELPEGAQLAALVKATHDAGHRAFVDVFGVDLSAGLADDPSLYAKPFDLGADIIQTDRPDLVLAYLGR